MATTYVYLVAIFLSSLIGLFNYNKFDKGGKILTWYLISVLITEVLSTIYSFDNLIIYIVGCAIQYYIILFYFNERFTNIKKYNLGIAINIASTIVFAVFAIYNHYSSRNIFVYSGLMEGFFMISFCLMAFYNLLNKEMSIQIMRVFDFWVISLLFLFCSVSYLYWGFSGIIFHYKYFKAIYYGVWAVDCILYIGIGCILYLYKKKILGSTN